MQITPLPERPFEILHIDILFLEKHYFLTCVDKFSKFAQVARISSRATVDVFPALKEFTLKYRPPEIIVMDGEKSFNSGEILQFLNTFNIKYFVTATGRSEMNGTVERFHSTLLELYRICKTENPLMVPIDLIQLALFKYNNSVHSCTKFTPLEIITPSRNSSSIIEKVAENLKHKQGIDLNHYNKNKKEIEIPDSAQAFMKTKRRLKQVNPYKKIKIKKINRSTVTTENGKRIHKNDLKVINI